MRAFHSLTASDTLSALQSSPVGLSEEEAQSRLQRLGENALPSRKKGGPFRLFLAQFKDFMTILLLCAAALSAVVAFGAEDAGGLTDTGILLLIVLLNAVVGFIQQYRADTAVEKLDRLSVCRVKAVRGGRDLLLDSRALVPGDLIVLEEGDMIPADCRILRAEELRCDESALTGESSGVSKSEAPVPESAPLAERRCMLYSSSFVVRGRAAAVVVGTGKDTEIGQIAGILAQTDAAKTPLEKALSVLGRIITAFVAAVAALLFLVGIFCKGEPLLHGFLSAVAVAVAAIPEGMPAVVTVIMAMGVQKMSRERAIVRRLHAVETLGSCSCICSDKTGTLTENRMTVEEVVTDFAPFGGGEVVSAGAPSRRSPSAPSPAAAASGTRGAEGGPSSVGSANSPSSVGPVGDISGGIAVGAGGIAGVGQRESLRRLYACMLACNSVRVRGGRLSGDPTEVALVAYARGRGAALSYKRLGGIPFSSEAKRMTVSVGTEEGRFDYVKGGADVLLRRCDRILDGGKVRPITERDRAAVLAATAALASRALRTLGFAYRAYTGAPRDDGLILIGVCGMIDPPRQGAAEAVAACKGAGITPVMITGDHRATAFAIASRLGIAESEGQVVTGAELDAMPPAALRACVPKMRVFARVSPKHKSLIVGQLQAAGNVVAMTGDGINDAPGIRKADIGIAMGISGTDVTKSAADMVIADDNFATIVTAVREGRRIFANIRKTVRFFLATNLAEVLAVLIASLAFWRLDFLTSTQLLWINLITDSLPVLSLGADCAERDCMLRPPERASSLFSPASLLSVAVYGGVQTALCIAVFAGGLRAYGNEVAVTMTFFVLSFLELFHSFNIRSEYGSAFGRGFFANKMLFVTVGIGVGVNLLLCALPPLRAAFGIVALTAGQWGVVFAASLAVIPAAELYKAAARLFRKFRRLPRGAVRVGKQRA